MLKLEEYLQFLKDVGKGNKQSEEELYQRLHNAMLACDDEAWIEIASAILGKELLYHEDEFDLPAVHHPIESYTIKAKIVSWKKGKVRGEAGV